MDETIATFHQAWNSFTERIREKFKDSACHSFLEPSDADKFLKNATTDLFYDSRPWGKWMSQFRNDYPEKAEEIKVIIESMKFQPLSEEITSPEEKGKWIPFVCMAVFYALAKQIFHTRTLSMIIALIVGAISGVISGIIITVLNSKENSGYKRKIMDGYIQQLENYKKQILEILSPEITNE